MSGAESDLDKSLTTGDGDELPSIDFLLAKLKRQTQRISALEAELASCKLQLLDQQQPPTPPPTLPPPPPPYSPPPLPRTRDTQSSFEYKQVLLLQKLDNSQKELDYVKSKYLQGRQNQRRRSNHQGYEEWELDSLRERCVALERLLSSNKPHHEENANWEEMQRLRMERADYENALTECRRHSELSDAQHDKQRRELLCVMDALQVDRAEDMVPRVESMKDQLRRLGEAARRSRDAAQSAAREHHQVECILARQQKETTSMSSSSSSSMQQLVQDLFASPHALAHQLAHYLSRVHARMEQARGERAFMKQEMDDCLAIAQDALLRVGGSSSRARRRGLREAVRELAMAVT